MRKARAPQVHHSPCLLQLEQSWYSSEDTAQSKLDKSFKRVSYLVCSHRQTHRIAEPYWMSPCDGKDSTGLQAIFWVPGLALLSPTEVLFNFIALLLSMKSGHYLLYFPQRVFEEQENSYESLWGKVSFIMYRNVNICIESLGSDQTAWFRKVSQDVGTISSRSFSQKHLLPVNRIPNECLILSFQAYNLLTFTSASMTLMTQWSMFFSITVALFYFDFWRSGDIPPYTNSTDQISQDFLTHIFCHFCHGPSILLVS